MSAGMFVRRAARAFTLALSTAAALAGCASGPKPLSASATPQERLQAAEAALASVKGLAKVTVDEKSETAPVGLDAQLMFGQGGAASLEASGVLGKRRITAELRVAGELLSRAGGSGATYASHQRPLPADFRTRWAQALIRLGVRAAVTHLVEDRDVDGLEGEFDAAAKLLAPTVAGAETIDGVACTRLNVSLERPTAPSAPVTLCVADATGLLLERAEGVAPAVSVERYVWTLK